MKRLCLVIPSLLTGGMERVMSELAEYFCKRGDLEVHLVIYGKIPEIFYTIPVNMVIHRPEKKFNNRFRKISTIGRLFYLRKTIKLINPESVLSFGEYWNSFVLIALYGLHYPVYISDRCSPEMRFGFFHKYLRKILYPKAAGIIAQTEKAKGLYSGQFKNSNICVIGNPIREIQDLGMKPKENIILTVGRLIESKHHDKLIELFSEIRKEGWKLVIVGDDALNQKNMVKLKELVIKLNMSDHIILAGKQSDMESYYLTSKIFAFTSSSEGFPNVLGEAMAAGLPVVSFNCIAGPDDLITNEKNGFLVPVFDYEHFKIRLLQLMESEDLGKILGHKAKESIKEYSLSKIGSAYYNFIFHSHLSAIEKGGVL